MRRERHWKSRTRGRGDTETRSKKQPAWGEFAEGETLEKQDAGTRRHGDTETRSKKQPAWGEFAEGETLEKQDAEMRGKSTAYEEKFARGEDTGDQEPLLER